MEKPKNKNRKLNSIFMLVFVVALSILVVIEISINVANEIEDQNRPVTTTSSIIPGDPTPTLFEVRPLE